MQLPLQITFRNMERLPEAEKWIGAETKKLEMFYNQIMSCRVAVEIPHGHHRKGRLYHIRIDLTLPGKDRGRPCAPSSWPRRGHARGHRGSGRAAVRAPHRN